MARLQCGFPLYSTIESEYIETLLGFFLRVLIILTSDFFYRSFEMGIDNVILKKKAFQIHKTCRMVKFLS